MLDTIIISFIIFDGESIDIGIQKNHPELIVFFGWHCVRLKIVSSATQSVNTTEKVIFPSSICLLYAVERFFDRN